jgi:hypothetical protein
MVLFGMKKKELCKVGQCVRIISPFNLESMKSLARQRDKPGVRTFSSTDTVFFHLMLSTFASY